MKKIETNQYKINKIAQPQGLTSVDPNAVDTGELAESTTLSLSQLGEDITPNILEKVNAQIKELLKGIFENQNKEIDKFVDENTNIFANMETVVQNLENNILALAATIDPAAAEEARLPGILTTVNYVQMNINTIKTNMEALKNSVKDMSDQVTGSAQMTFEQLK